MPKIRVIDALPGSHKTTAMQQFIVRMSQYQPCLYVTPTLDEATSRMSQESLQEAMDYLGEAYTGNLPEFKVPERKGSRGTKTASLDMLLQAGESVACSHELLRRLSPHGMQAIRDYNYIVVIDEAVSPWETLPAISEADVRNMKQLGYLIPANIPVSYQAAGEGKADKFEVLQWDFNSYPIGISVGRYADVRTAGQLGHFFVTPNAGLLVNEYPMRLFDADVNTYCLTYGFQKSMMASWCNIMGIECEDVTKHFLPEYDEAASINTLRGLLEIYDGPHNAIGSQRTKRGHYDPITDTALSAGSMGKSGMRSAFNKAARNVLMGWCVASDEALITFIKGEKKLSSTDCPKGYFTAVRPCNLRATNSLANRKAVVYGANLFCNPDVVLMLERMGATIDQEHFALTEMLQFIWRGCVRRGEPMKLFVPSRRMRHLLLKWLGYADHELF